MPVWIMFSTICICFSTSISRSAACTCSVTPRRSAASCAPRRISTKNGWFSVLRTSAMVGFAVGGAGPRLHDSPRAGGGFLRAAPHLDEERVVQRLEDERDGGLRGGRRRRAIARQRRGGAQEQ